MNKSPYFPIAVLMGLVFLQPSFIQAQTCTNTKPSTFTVHLPVMNIPPDEEGQGWVRPDIWNGVNAGDDSIVVPNGRPIYALIVSGYASNKYLDEMMLYNFARHLMSKGAYVHYSWWNNLLAPYMQRPLHHSQSHPGSLTVAQLSAFLTPASANEKALPGEDYQFLQDAKNFLRAIRQNNPNAMIIVAGHSMGGGAIVHLGSQTNELIDILAPIDPVGNRNFPFADPVERVTQPDFNWTRWRVSRDNFLGYKKSYNAGTILNPNCLETGNWLPEIPTPTSSDLLCLGTYFVDNAASTVRFRSNIINLYHRYQQEALFPFDFNDSYHFVHFPRRPNSFSTQEAVAMIPGFCGFGILCSDPEGWSVTEPPGNKCCPTQPGDGWGADGHGEIVGYRGPGDPIPLGVRLRTSPQCGNGCSGLVWPSRILNGSTWDNGDGISRRQKLRALEILPIGQQWPDRPIRPQLCKVSQGLIELYDDMNKPPTANAGNDQTVECTGPNGALVTLNGLASSDPDGDALEYNWNGSFGNRTGEVVAVTLPLGTHCITLTVTDPSGHLDNKKVKIIVEDKTGPAVNVSLSPSLLWPPNHKLIDINATVSASDLCGTVQSIVLYSIVASEGAEVVGSGNTSPDIAGADYNTYDLAYKLRAERSGPNKRRVYTVTYKATDNSGNITLKSAEVVVENPSAHRGQTLLTETNADIYSDPSFVYPNPFKTTTRINYYLPVNASVKIEIFNSTGQLVTTPVNHLKQTGFHYVIFDGKDLPGGIYTCRIIMGTNISIHKIVLMK